MENSHRGEVGGGGGLKGWFGKRSEGHFGGRNLSGKRLIG